MMIALGSNQLNMSVQEYWNAAILQLFSSNAFIMSAEQIWNVNGGKKHIEMMPKSASELFAVSKSHNPWAQ